MASLRELPENFGKGLTLDATRIEQNLVKLESLRDVPPHLIQRRHFPSWLVWGYSPDTNVVPIPLPFLREENTDTEAPVPAVIHNMYRHKAIYTPGIPYGGISSMRTWEVSFENKRPTHITRVYAFMATDTEYTNTFQYTAPTPPPTKTIAQPLDDMAVQVFVDDHLDPEDRRRTSVELGTFQRSMRTYYASNVALNPAWDTMQPAHPTGPANAVLMEAEGSISLPAGRIRVAVTIPEYDTLTYSSSWGTYSFQPQVWSIGVCLHEGTNA